MMYFFCSYIFNMSSLKSAHDVRQALRSVFARDGYAVVMIFSPRCGHCRNALPGFEQAADSNDRPHRTYATIDTTDNNLGTFVTECDVTSVPKFFVLRSDYSIEEVHPERTAQGFLDV